jgi:archaellum biogenesis ATPase FlaH
MKTDKVLKDLTRKLTVSVKPNNKEVVASTGNSELDSLLDGGLKTGDLYRISGMTNSGKSLLLTTLASSLVKNGNKVGFISSDLPKLTVARILSNLENKDFSFEPSSISKNTKKKLSNFHLINMDPVTNSKKMTKMISRLNFMECDFIFIDDIQLIGKCSHDAVQETIDNLRLLADSLNISVVFSSTLTRGGIEWGASMGKCYSSLKIVDYASSDFKLDVSPLYKRGGKLLVPNALYSKSNVLAVDKNGRERTENEK